MEETVGILRDGHGGQFASFFKQDQTVDLGTINPPLAQELRVKNDAFRDAVEINDSDSFSVVAEHAVYMDGETSPNPYDDINAYFIGALSALRFFRKTDDGEAAVVSASVNDYRKFAPVFSRRGIDLNQRLKVEHIESIITASKADLAVAIQKPELTAVRYGLASMSASVILAAKRK